MQKLPEPFESYLATSGITADTCQALARGGFVTIDDVDEEDIAALEGVARGQLKALRRLTQQRDEAKESAKRQERLLPVPSAPVGEHVELRPASIGIRSVAPFGWKNDAPAQLPLDIEALAGVDIASLVHKHGIDCGYLWGETFLATAKSRAHALHVVNSESFRVDVRLRQTQTSQDFTTHVCQGTDEAKFQRSTNVDSDAGMNFTGLLAAMSGAYEASDLIHVVASVRAPCVELSVDPKAGAFVINPLLVRHAKAVTTREQLRTFFESWGCAIATSVVLGLSVTFSKSVRREAGKTLAEQSAELKAEAAHVVNPASSHRFGESININKNVAKTSLGPYNCHVQGGAALASLKAEDACDIAKWRHDPRAWAIIGLKRVRPTYSFLPLEDKVRFMQLLTTFRYDGNSAVTISPTRRCAQFSADHSTHSLVVVDPSLSEAHSEVFVEWNTSAGLCLLIVPRGTRMHSNTIAEVRRSCCFCVIGDAVWINGVEQTGATPNARSRRSGSVAVRVDFSSEVVRLTSSGDGGSQKFCVPGIVAGKYCVAVCLSNRCDAYKVLDAQAIPGN